MRGLIEKIPYLQALGITAVELLPVFQFDAQACPPGVVNYWGYQPVSFFAPHRAYSSRQEPLGPVHEFRDMVKALHRAGIEVILDVVFNHTAEGGADGPTLSLRGIDNPTYYILEAGRRALRGLHRLRQHAQRQQPGRPADDRRQPALLGDRDARGRLPVRPRLDPVARLGRAAGAEPAGAVGHRDRSGARRNQADCRGVGCRRAVPGGQLHRGRWKEWNGRFRDDCRDFFRGAPGSLGRFADRLVGSPEVYGHKGREAEQSVNFVTCHDGFTLNDLVSYDRKHNEANGESNRDGADDNRSWNCGVEGPSDDPAVEALRNRQVKNYLTVTMLALGVPMILMGDEVRRTQGGNNNAYCHDDESTWFDWSLVEKHADVHRFVTLLAARRAAA